MDDKLLFKIGKLGGPGGRRVGALSMSFANLEANLFGTEGSSKLGV